MGVIYSIHSTFIYYSINSNNQFHCISDFYLQNTCCTSNQVVVDVFSEKKIHDCFVYYNLGRGRNSLNRKHTRYLFQIIIKSFLIQVIVNKSFQIIDYHKIISKQLTIWYETRYKTQTFQEVFIVKTKLSKSLVQGNSDYNFHVGVILTSIMLQINGMKCSNTLLPLGQRSYKNIHYDLNLIRKADQLQL